MSRSQGTGARDAELEAEPSPASSERPSRRAALIGGAAVLALGPTSRASAEELWRSNAAFFEADPAAPLLSVLIEGVSSLPDRGRIADRVLSVSAPLALALDPREEGCAAFAERARQFGHECLIAAPATPDAETPLEAEADGAAPLHLTLPAEANAARLAAYLARVPGAIGVLVGGAGEAGSGLALAPRAMAPLMDALAARGALVIDAAGSGRSTVALLAARGGGPASVVDARIDDRPEGAMADVRQIFLALDRLATALPDGGGAIAMGAAAPETVSALDWWLRSRASRRVALAPLTAVAARKAALG